MTTMFAVNETQVLRVLTKLGYQLSGVSPHGPSGLSFHIQHQGEHGSVIVSQAEHFGDEWLHASIAYERQIPNYDDLTALHRAVFGRKRWAYQVFAPESEHVNIHSYALHLWGRADGKPALPNFAEGFGTI